MDVRIKSGRFALVLFAAFTALLTTLEGKKLDSQRKAGKRSSASSARCDFGRLPGTMLPTGSATAPYHWHIHEEACRLKPLLYQHMDPDPNNTGRRQPADVSFLLIGDSVDHRIAKEFARLAASSAGKSLNESGYKLYTVEDQTAVMTPSMQVVYRFIPGVAPQGPYHNNFDAEKTPTVLVPEAFQIFSNVTQKARPNAVVFNALFWDVGGLTHLNRQNDWTFKDGKRLPPRNISSEPVFLPLALIEAWMHNTKSLMRLIEELAGGDAVLIYHNSAPPRVLDCQHSAFLAHPGLGSRTFIQQLNGAARQVVRKKKRWHFVDFGHISEALPESEYLADNLHPQGWFLRTALNVFLNIFEEFRN